MLKGLRDLATGTSLLWEVRRLRKDLHALTQAVARIAAAVELQNAHTYPQVVPGPVPPLATEVTFVDTLIQAQMVDAELRLTRATGQPPTEDEILSEYERTYGQPVEEGGPQA